MSCCTPTTPQGVCCAPKPELAADVPCCGTETAVKDHAPIVRALRMVTIPNQSSVPKAFTEFEGGRMKPSPYYDRIVDVMEELVRFTALLRPHVAQLADRYSERKEDAAKLEARTKISAV